jgi:hypothetical protein
VVAVHNFRKEESINFRLPIDDCGLAIWGCGLRPAIFMTRRRACGLTDKEKPRHTPRAMLTGLIILRKKKSIVTLLRIA